MSAVTRLDAIDRVIGKHVETVRVARPIAPPPPPPATLYNWLLAELGGSWHVRQIGELMRLAFAEPELVPYLGESDLWRNIITICTTDRCAYPVMRSPEGLACMAVMITGEQTMVADVEPDLLHRLAPELHTLKWRSAAACESLKFDRDRHLPRMVERLEAQAAQLPN